MDTYVNLGSGNPFYNGFDDGEPRGTIWSLEDTDSDSDGITGARARLLVGIVHRLVPRRDDERLSSPRCVFPGCAHRAQPRSRDGTDRLAGRSDFTDPRHARR